MRKLLITVLFLGLVTGLSAQSIWKPLPKVTVTSNGTKMLGDKTLTNYWHWRFDGTIIADELVYVKADKKFVSQPLSGVGPTIGYKHFSISSDGTLFNDYGVAGGVLVGTNIYDLSNISAKFVVLGSFLDHYRVGCSYTTNTPNHFGIVIGGGISF
jgi:hypothetical protein